MKPIVEYPERTMAANADTYWPTAFSDQAFLSWSQRITLKVLNLRDPGNPHARTANINAVFFSEGVPCSDWALGYGFLMSLTKLEGLASHLTTQTKASAMRAALGEIK